MWQSKHLDLWPRRRYQKVGRSGSRSLPPVGWIGADGRLERPEEGCPGSTARWQDHVAAHGDLLQLPVNVRKELAQGKDDQTAQLRTPQAVLAVHTADCR